MDKVYYFMDGNDRCRFRCLQKDGNLVYEVAMIEVCDDGTVEVFYLERFRELDNALNTMESKGVFDMPFYPPEEELAFWENVCI